MLGAYETASTTLGESEKAVQLTWRLYHEGADGVWRAAYAGFAPQTTALPELATGPGGQALTGGDTSGLGADPASLCGRYCDWVRSAPGTDPDGKPWSDGIDDARAKRAAWYADRLEVPVGTGEVSVAAEASWPYVFDGTRYDGGWPGPRRRPAAPRPAPGSRGSEDHREEG